jgi:transposase
LPAHEKAIVKDYVASAPGKLTLHFLPGHAPDLNPDECADMSLHKHSSTTHQ